jgi:hypothetical protein
MYASWLDVDFTGKAFTVREILYLGFTPKDKEEGTIPATIADRCNKG